MAVLITNPTDAVVLLPPEFYQRSIGPNEGLVVADTLVATTAALTGLGLAVSSIGAGGGDVSGPGASTDNALPRWDGVGGALLQNSTAILSDLGELALTSTGLTGTALGVTANALTSGTGLLVQSSSADATGRTLARVANTGSVNTTVLRLEQAGVGSPALDVQGRQVVNSADTTGDALRISASSLTTGHGLLVDSTSADLGTRKLVEVLNSSVLATGTTALHVENLAPARALRAISAATTTQVVDVQADSLSTGNALRILSSSVDVSARSMVKVEQNSAVATGAILLELAQSGPAGALSIPNAATTTGAVISATSSTLTTGSLASLVSSSPDTGTRDVAFVRNSSALATGTTTLHLQSSAGSSLTVDHGASSQAVQVTAGSTIANAVVITADSLIGGSGLRVESASADASVRRLVSVVNTNAGSTGTVGLQVDQSGPGAAFKVVGAGSSTVVLDIDSGATAGTVLDIVGSSLTAGSLGRLFSASADVTSRKLFSVENDNLFATGARVAEFRQEANQVSLDLTGAGGGSVQFQERATVPGGVPAAGKAKVWVINSAPNRLVFTDDVGTDNIFSVLTGITSADTTALGIGAGAALTGPAVDNTLIGVNAGAAINTGLRNLVAGDSSAPALTSGDDNILLGFNVGSTLDTGNNNLLAGSGTDVGPATSGAIVLGRSAAGVSASAAADNVFALHPAVASVTTGTVMTYAASGQAGPVATTANIISNATTQIALSVTSSSLTTGSAFDVQSASTDTGTRNLVGFANTNAASTGTTTLNVANASTGRAVNITASTLTLPVVDITASAITTGNALRVNSSSTSVSTRTAVTLENNSAAATGTTVLGVTQVANQISVDLTGAGGGSIQFQEIAAAPGAAPGAGKGKLWVRNDAPNRLIFSDDAGNTHAITPLPNAILGFGNASIATVADTRYLDPWYSDGTAGTTIVEMVVTRAGTLRNLFVRHNAATGNGNTVVYTAGVNGAATGITCTLATGAIGQASDIVNTAAVVQGDRISITAAKAVSIGAANQIIQATLEVGN